MHARTVLPWHEVSPDAQPRMHAPLTQSLPAPQSVPQPPQLRGSVMSATQRAPHEASPVGHTHAPAVQLAPVGHCVKHEPHAKGSVARLTHEPPQLVRPAAHTVVHLPSEHTCPVAQAMPQPPQLARSDWTSVHPPRQRMPPLKHAH